MFEISPLRHNVWNLALKADKTVSVSPAFDNLPKRSIAAKAYLSKFFFNVFFASGRFGKETLSIVSVW